jgi:hypothetical protein
MTPARSAVRGLGPVAAGLVLMAGCSPLEVAACTAIGAPSGVNVTVENEIAGQVRKVTLTICHADDCQDHPVDLIPGSDSVDQGCTGTGPDAACSATAVPNGSKVGFVQAELPVGTLKISATVIRAGKPQRLGPIDVEAKATYPNGPSCPAGGNQTKITIGPQGLRA